MMDSHSVRQITGLQHSREGGGEMTQRRGGWYLIAQEGLTDETAGDKVNGTCSNPLDSVQHPRQ